MVTIVTAERGREIFSIMKKEPRTVITEERIWEISVCIDVDTTSTS